MSNTLPYKEVGSDKNYLIKSDGTKKVGYNSML